MKLRDDLILQFELKDFVDCTEVSKIGTKSFYIIFDTANSLLAHEMQRWPVLDTRDNKAIPNFARVHTRVMPEQHDTPESILKEIIEWSDRSGIVEYKGKPPSINNFNYFLNKAKKLLGKL